MFHLPSLMSNGPSPRMRGKPDRQQDHEPRRGSIPAHAGKLTQEGYDDADKGSIPAHAGETGKSEHLLVLQPVHPRACGGNTLALIERETDTGPSPRMRGKLRSGAGHAGARRSIPAHAGETVTVPSVPVFTGVHPRACGETDMASTSFNRPRVHPRACGGNLGGRAVRRQVYVHPRACGGNVSFRVPSSAERGPSPRMRGKRVTTGGSIGPHGSIPAHAGETIWFKPSLA